MNVLIQLLVPESENPESLVVQPSRSLLVMSSCGCVAMLGTIQLDDQLLRKAGKVDDVLTNRRLTPEAISVKCIRTKMTP